MTAADVVVAGGGVIGLSIAWESSLEGLSVIVVDPLDDEGASWAAAGMLAPVTEVHYGEERLLKLNLESIRLYPGFAARLNEASGRNCGYVESGTLVVSRDADDNAALDDLFAFQQRLGLDVERLRGRDCRRLEPSLAPSTRGGILVRGDHQVDNRALLGSLRAACERSGVRFVRRRVVRAELNRGRVSGVRLDDDEDLSCGALVVAAGARSGEMEGLPPGALPPVRPVKGQLLHLRGAPGERLATHTIRGLEAYLLVRPDGRVVLGATVEERGYDERVTAGGVYELLRAGYELVPGITELELVEVSVGLRPGSPDNAPMLGAASVDGLIIATGHFRNGILLAPVTGRTIAELLVTSKAPEIIRPFSPQRFESHPRETARAGA
ncbi:MAG: glycine oxidase ThiO [Actinomycetota bacterium]